MSELMSSAKNLKEYQTKMNYNNEELTFSISASDKIIHFQVYKDNDFDKFKSFFTYDRLLRRSTELGRISENLDEAVEKIFNSVKENKYSLVINYSLSYLILRIEFSNNKLECSSNKNLEIYLYKTDSKQFDSKIETLKDRIEKLNLENEELRDINSQAIMELEKLVQDNIDLKQQFNQLNDTVLHNDVELVESLKEEQENKIEDTEISLKKLKQDLINSYNNPVMIKANLNFYIPIISNYEKNELFKKWFKCDCELVLAYDSVTDGDDSLSFHSKCDGKIQTLTIIETVHGLRFGGYTRLFWDHSDSFKSDDDSAFVFSVDKNVKFNCTDQSKVIYCSNKQGPTFGKGPDIFIADKFLSNDSSSCIQGSYGEKDDLDKKYSRKNYLAGVEIFRVKRIEVYQVIFN